MAGTIKITIDHTKINASLTDFPVMVHLSGSSGINTADISGIFNELTYSGRKKFSITTSDGTLCYVEISYLSDADKQAFLWVKVPNISSTSDTVLYLDYDAMRPDNPNVGDTGSIAAQKVWDNGYVCVLHMANTGTQIDSSPNGKNATVSGGSPERQWVNNFGFMQYFDGVSGDAFQIPDGDGSLSVLGTGKLVYSFWFALAAKRFLHTTGSYPGYSRIFGKGKSGQHEYTWVYNDEGYSDRSQRVSWYIFSPDGGQGAGHYMNPTDVIEVGELVHATGKLIITDSSTLNGQLTVYKNGVLKHSRYWQDSQYNVVPGLGSAPVGIGKRLYDSDGLMYGWIGEIRISNVDRSNTWISASYFNEIDQLLKFETGGFHAGSSRTANIPVTVIPSGLSCQIELWLGPDVNTKSATSGKVSFTSTGVSQNIVLPITMPATGTYNVYVDIYSGGQIIKSIVYDTPVVV